MHMWYKAYDITAIGYLVLNKKKMEKKLLFIQFLDLLVAKSLHSTLFQSDNQTDK